MIIKSNPSLIKRVKTLDETNNVNMNVASLLVDAFSYTDIIDEADIKQYIKEGLNEKEAVLEALCRFFSIDYEEEENKTVLDDYLLNNLVKLNPEDYTNNPYVEAIKAVGKRGKYSLKYIDYAPYQLFAYDDIYLDGDKEFSRIGYFNQKFSYLALCEGNNIWMSLNPNEIETMKPYIDAAKGKVLVLGLGMGYVPFMMALKDNVESITIIEKDPEIISLFNDLIWPNFKNKEKIKIVQDDAISYYNKRVNQAKYDYAFADLWHSPEDGLSLFVNLKRANRCIDCWLEVSMFALLKRCMITLLIETLDKYGEDNYKHARNYTDKIINKYYEKTKNLTLEKDEDLDNLLKDDNLLNLLID